MDVIENSKITALQGFAESPTPAKSAGVGSPRSLAPLASSLDDQSLLLDLPVPFRSVSGKLWVEAQVLNGIRLWSENFSRLTVCAPVLPVGHPDESQTDWADPSELLKQRAIKLVPLPWGYRRFESLGLAGEVRATLAPLIDGHRYLCFCNVGGFGAWGNLGVEIALRKKRPYSVWFDNVADKMPRTPARSLTQKLKSKLDMYLGKIKTYHAIRHAGLGLFHGRTVFDAYSPLCPRGELVHNIHCSPLDALSDAQLLEKLARQESKAVLRIGYAGRAHPIKGPFDWIDTLAELARRVGPERFKATWYGSGPVLEEARRRVEEAGLGQRVRFAGHVRNREALLLSLRQLDVFLFCHLTPESPRCLIESLISCTPLVGYESAYARDLVVESGGGDFGPMGDTTALAAKLEHLVNDRDALKNLIQAAAKARPLYNDEAVFKHRSDLIKASLV